MYKAVLLGHRAKYLARIRIQMLPKSLHKASDIDINRKPEFDSESRAASYAIAHRDCPDARRRELEETLSRIGNAARADVLEIGAGQGFLTRHLVSMVGDNGRVVAVDNSEEQLAELRKLLPTVRVERAHAERLPFNSESFDLVVSLANFHHVSDKRVAFRECARVLKPGGRFLLVDVSDNTPTQMYFDYVVDAICSTGHQHTFLNRSLCERFCTECGLSMNEWTLEDVDWQFANEEKAAKFLQCIHDANCSAKDCLKRAVAHLGLTAGSSGTLHLGWQLFFMVATKL